MKRRRAGHRGWWQPFVVPSVAETLEHTHGGDPLLVYIHGDPLVNGWPPLSPEWPLPPRSPARYPVDVSRVPFIAPAQPVLRSSPPSDGYRVQLHKAGAGATIFSRNGADFSRRFPNIAAAIVGLPTRSCVIDGEVIAAGRHDQPDFLALLHGRHVPTCVYCFDLLELNGRDLREQPLVQRRARLEALLKRAKCNVIRFSETFPNANDLLAECARLSLEGIVAKRKDAPYRSGARSGWVKVKTEEWKAVNRWRAEFFEKPAQR